MSALTFDVSIQNYDIVHYRNCWTNNASLLFIWWYCQHGVQDGVYWRRYVFEIKSFVCNLTVKHLNLCALVCVDYSRTALLFDSTKDSREWSDPPSISRILSISMYTTRKNRGQGQISVVHVMISHNLFFKHTHAHAHIFVSLKCFTVITLIYWLAYFNSG